MEEEEEEDTSPPFWTESGGRRRLRRSYSLFLSSSAPLICLLVIALAFMLVIIPTLHSFTTQIFKPNSVKKSWDSLNFVLILFAILCGFLSRNNSNTNESFSDTPLEYDKPNPPLPRPWYEESDRTPYKSYNRLRSFSSHPNLRQESQWLAADERWRFYDDTHVNGYRGFDLEEHRQHRTEAGEEESVENIEVVAKEVPPPPAPAERRSGGNKNKRTSATKELLTSSKGKKKKQRQGNVESVKSIPSQPSSVFHNMFSSKESKLKKVNSASSSHVSFSKTEPVRGDVVATSSRSNKREDFYASEENVVVTGNDSPLISIPPPPPPPPFKMPAWKFRVQGDFVRIDGISSWSSDLEDEIVESPSSEDGGAPEILLFYPSPDVDTKADTFIERFRAGLREEKKGIRTSNLRPSPKPEAGRTK
ncbi:hypothetical protein JHK87_041153 [Glycine soja]|nr:hypothetical protein JHK87_041153 [Glycine soja]